MNRAFYDVCEYAYHRGARSIKDLAGCFEAHIDDHWWVAINGHTAETAASTGVSVPPCSVYVEFNGWPAGIISAAGGWIAAGAAANEEAFLRAIAKAMKEKEEK